MGNRSYWISNRIVCTSGIASWKFLGIMGGGTSLRIDEYKLTSNMGNVLPFSHLRYKRTYVEVFCAELLGTALLLFFGCMSCISLGNVTTDSYVSSAAFGFIIASIIGIFGHISSAHLNPAISFAIYSMGGMKFSKFLVYITAELLGAIFGMGVLLVATPDDWLPPGICATEPHSLLSSSQALAIEFTCTFFLCLLMCGLKDSQSSNSESSLKFAIVIIALGLACGKYTGASMNPARTLAPAIWTGHWDRHWVYWLGPLSAAAVGPQLYKFIWSPRKYDCSIEAIPKE